MRIRRPFFVYCSIISDFDKDFKNSKYDVIFVPYRLFKDRQNFPEFVSYFDKKIAYRGLDHPVLAKDYWAPLCATGEALGATMYLMSKEGFDELTFVSEEDKMKWLIENII